MNRSAGGIKVKWSGRISNFRSEWGFLLPSLRRSFNNIRNSDKLYLIGERKFFDIFVRSEKHVMSFEKSCLLKTILFRINYIKPYICITEYNLSFETSSTYYNYLIRKIFRCCLFRNNVGLKRFYKIIIKEGDLLYII